MHLAWRSSSGVRPDKIDEEGSLARKLQALALVDSSPTSTLHPDRPFESGLLQGTFTPSFSLIQVPTLKVLCVHACANYLRYLPHLQHILPPELLGMILNVLAENHAIEENGLCKLISSEMETVNLQGQQQLSDKMCAFVADRCPQLQHLALSGCSKLTHSSLASLSSNTSLKSLDVSGCLNITHLGLSIVGRSGFASGLQELRIGGLGLEYGTVASLAGSLPVLRRLDMSMCMLLTDAGVQAVARGCALLEELSLQGCTLLSDAAVSAISRLPLRLLDLGGLFRVTDSSIELLASRQRLASSLVSISLAGCGQVSDKSLIQLANACPSLCSVDICANAEITDLSCAALARSSRGIRNLNVSACVNLTDNGIESLYDEGCTELQSLSLSDNPCITETSLITLGGRATGLTRLSLASLEAVTDSSLQALALGCPSVTIIDLSYCSNLTFSSLKKALYAWEKLREIGLKGFNDIATSGLIHAQLQVLNLAWCPRLQDSALLQTSRNCPALRVLNLAGCPSVTGHGVLKVAEHCRYLQCVNVSRCPGVPDMVVKYLGLFSGPC